jgi:hypothetical protein
MVGTKPYFILAYESNSAFTFQLSDHKPSSPHPMENNHWDWSKDLHVSVVQQIYTFPKTSIGFTNVERELGENTATDCKVGC